MAPLSQQAMDKGGLRVPAVVGKSMCCCRRCYRDFTAFHAGERHFLTFTKRGGCGLELYAAKQPRTDVALLVEEQINTAFPEISFSCLFF